MAPDPSPGWTLEREEALARLVGTNLSLSEIAQKLGGGLSRCAVQSKINRMKMNRPGKAAPPPAKIDLTKHRSGFNGPAPKKPPAVVPNVEGVPIFEAVPDDAGLKLLLNLGAGCKWPVGAPGPAGQLFCAEAKDADGPYCATHTARAFQPRSVNAKHSAKELARSLRKHIR